MKDIVIQTQSLAKTYGDTRAVNDLSLRVHQGEVYAFLGLNGAGKTTTIRMLLGMVKPTAGTVAMFGNTIEPGETDVWSSVGYLVESASAYPELSVYENLEVVRRLRQGCDRRAIDQVVERLSLGVSLHRAAGTLSLGNRQRLGLAKALLHRPQLLILDEPTNGLDPAGIVEIRELLRELTLQDGVTVFMSSHLLAEVAKIADRIGILHEGKLVQEMNRNELEKRRIRRLEISARYPREARQVLLKAGYALEPEAGERIFLTDERAMKTPDDVCRLLVGSDHPPMHLAVQEEDLEHYFLRLIGKDGRRHD